jgi:hypothetical protein
LEHVLLHLQCSTLKVRPIHATYTYRPFACLGLLRHVSAWDV